MSVYTHKFPKSVRLPIESMVRVAAYRASLTASRELLEDVDVTFRRLGQFEYRFHLPGVDPDYLKALVLYCMPSPEFVRRCPDEVARIEEAAFFFALER